MYMPGKTSGTPRALRPSASARLAAWAPPGTPLPCGTFWPTPNSPLARRIAFCPTRPDTRPQQMAGYKGHLAGATAFAIGYLALIAYAFSVDAAYRQFTIMEQVGYPLALVVLALLFGLWPDVDTDSKG